MIKLTTIAFGAFDVFVEMELDVVINVDGLVDDEIVVVDSIIFDFVVIISDDVVFNSISVEVDEKRFESMVVVVEVVVVVANVVVVGTQPGLNTSLLEQPNAPKHEPHSLFVTFKKQFSSLSPYNIHCCGSIRGDTLGK